MRVQFQDSVKGKTQNTHALAIDSKSEEGVTVAQVEKATKALVGSLRKVKSWPKQSHAEFKKAAKKMLGRIKKLPPNGIFKQGANVVRVKFSRDDIEYRVDLENLRGHNLRS